MTDQEKVEWMRQEFNMFYGKIVAIRHLIVDGPDESYTVSSRKPTPPIKVAVVSFETDIEADTDEQGILHSMWLVELMEEFPALMKPQTVIYIKGSAIGPDGVLYPRGVT